MTTHLGKRRAAGASVLLATLVIVLILGLTLGSYLLLVNAQNVSVARSQGWNAALAMAEAGVEEALAHIGAGGALADNGWNQSTGGVFGPVSRRLADGSYTVVIVTNPAPTIYATGYVTVPALSANLSRALEVKTASAPLFNVAFGAVQNIRMNGKGVASDSFNSHDPNLSTNGQYDPTKTSTNGNVASVGGIVDIGNHTITGNLYLGPTATYNSGAGQVSGQIFNDFNVNFPDVVLPAATWFPAPVSTVVSGKKTTSIYNFTTSGDYYVSDSKDILVQPGVSVRVQVTASSFSPASVHILGGITNSGTLAIYQIAGSVSMSGNVSVDSGRAENFFYYGLPGVTSITYSGTSSFVGALYAPEADLTLNGGGNNIGLVGSSITKTITMNGHYDFHYDEALRNGPSTGYRVVSWREL